MISNSMSDRPKTTLSGYATPRLKHMALKIYDAAGNVLRGAA